MSNFLEGLSVEAPDAEFAQAEKRGERVRINGKTMLDKKVAAGTELVRAHYEGIMESTLYPGQIDYSFRGALDSQIILKGNASVKRQMASIQPGELTRIVYTGTYTSAKAPGKVCHAFLIEGALNTDADDTAEEN